MKICSEKSLLYAWEYNKILGLCLEIVCVCAKSFVLSSKLKIAIANVGWYMDRKTKRGGSWVSDPILAFWLWDTCAYAYGYVLCLTNHVRLCCPLQFMFQNVMFRACCVTEMLHLGPCSQVNWIKCACANEVGSTLQDVHTHIVIIKLHWAFLLVTTIPRPCWYENW
jgi:hypothetical protein